MFRFLPLLFVAITLFARPVTAQSDQVWIQIEAQPTLQAAQQSIQGYAGRLQDVNGFALDGGWYGIALGPYTREDASRVLYVLRREGTIPRDSYIAFSSAYRQQFYPVGANASGSQGTASAGAATDTGTGQTTEAAAAPEPVQEPDETPAQARRSEAELSREERMELQVMLQWAGFYTAGIDGAFGPGTRRSMADWQRANNFEPTGILTTLQRRKLKKQYNAVLDGLGLQTVADTRAGIEMQIPTGVVAKKGYEAPFVHFEASGDVAAQVILISQEGDAATLRGLYEIMQTLAIVPPEGARERRNSSFTIEGQNARVTSYTEAALEDGQIKGFTLVWPAGDEERRARLLGEMRGSFRTIDGVLEASAGLDESQRIDLVSGLEVRKPLLSRSGFYVDNRGSVLTSAAAVAACGRITLDGVTEAQVAAKDDALGLAVLRPAANVAPLAVAQFATAVPRLQSEVAVAGYPYEGVLGAPTLTFGRLAELRGLAGEDTLWRLDLSAQAGDAGGPVMDQTGAVIGVLLPQGEGGAQKLPDGVRFIADTQSVLSMLQSAGIAAEAASASDMMAPEDMTRIAGNMTVLIGCWE